MDVCRMAERAYGRLSTILKHEIAEPVPLILYASQAEFQQTNVSDGLIGEGTGGFTEFLKGRVALPLTGSYRDLDHVLTHELVHAFQVDILFGGKKGVGNPFQSAPPLWFMEGMAEYLSLVEIDPLTAMWLRDGALEGYLTPLPILSQVGDIRVYRYGQSVMAYLGATFGDQALGDILKKTAHTRNLARAFEETIGVTLEKFSENWVDHVRREYLPTIRDHRQPGDFAYRLTHADRELSTVNLGPALSPEGDRMVYFSNPSMYNDIYLASAVDGQVEKRLVKGERQAEFESLRYYTSSIDWSPDGEKICFAALDRGRDALYIQRVRDGKILKRIRPPLDGILAPSWSPDGEWIAFAGLEGGRSQLFRVRSDGADLERLTEGRFMVSSPRYAPDGRSIVFVSDQGPATDSANLLFDLPQFVIFELESRQVRQVEGLAGRCVDPHYFPDGRHLLFVSDRSGIANLWIRDLESGEDRQITDVLTGVSGIIPTGTSVSLSRSGRRLVFSAFSAGTWDLYSIKDPLQLWAKGTPWTPPPATELDSAQIADSTHASAAVEEIAPAEGGPADDQGGAEALVQGDPDSLDRSTGPDQEAQPAADVDSLRSGPLPVVIPLPAAAPGTPSPAFGGGDEFARLDSLWANIETMDRVGRDTLSAAERAAGDAPVEPEQMFAARVFRERRALPDTGAIAIEPYRSRFSADYVAANGFFASNLGLAAQSVLRFSDILGNQVILVGADVYGSLKDSNLLLEYVNLKRRTTWGVSAFQFRNDFYIFTTDTDEEFLSRIYRGVNFTVQRPWNRFSRLEASLDAQAVTEEVLREDGEGSGYYYPFGDTSTYYYLEPGFALVQDNTLYGYTGPISGGRRRLSIEAGVGDLSFQTYLADVRRYVNFRHQYAIAYRAVGAISTGRDPQRFQIGGPYTLRGYEFGEFRGSRLLMQNLEFRFPLIEQLQLGWPLPLALAGVRGAIFFDVGTALDEDETFHPFTNDGGSLAFDDLRGSYGLSASMSLGFTVLKWDLSWRTDLARTLGPPRGFLSFGLDY
ncbi:MAG: PD40 domain-containing protein [Candidatus Eisenbacteria bacterium]|nr:PD40 domain-containing protein [Candidatus Eisenbacteria bacterium]